MDDAGPGSPTGLAPHPTATLWEACAFFKRFKAWRGCFADPENSMTSPRFRSRQRGRLSSTTVYRRPNALWLLREGDHGAHDTVPLLRCLIRNNVWTKCCNRCHLKDGKHTPSAPDASGTHLADPVLWHTTATAVSPHVTHQTQHRSPHLPQQRQVASAPGYHASRGVQDALEQRSGDDTSGFVIRRAVIPGQELESWPNPVVNQDALCPLERSMQVMLEAGGLWGAVEEEDVTILRS
ncbi:uncharacterized protein LOC125107590 [Lutra lutra]|uniref:uncharacterized protein LOC125107590 n=1 Tax=Lutra lutra TaxID=9657 RepID=UPI001FD32E08|nr:uncharacterized protein LOC125107590 [Lutra lutra]